MQNYREILQKKFKEEYEKLNTEQRKAVDSIEGPVMVIAGPGTGKTQILAARIGKILLETDVLPHNILCLTYTDAGVVAMRRRLVQFIGADAYRVNIFTFHAFCNDVIQDNLSLFDKNSLNPVSDLQRIQLMKELIDDFPKNHLLKRYRGDVYCEIYSLTKLFSGMKNEGWAPTFINKKIDEYVKELPTRDEYFYKRASGPFKKGDLKINALETENLKMERLRCAVNEFDNFQKLMHKNNLYDFDDMINWVIKVFEENKNVLANYQEKFQYILVDEFQDTSGTQNKIVELLISYWQSPNIFVVGDDDQSIFRFQGANVENMGTFAEGYVDLLKVVLTNNYRSTQPILNISKTLIGNNNERLIKKLPGLSKELISSRIELKDVLHEPVIREYQSLKDEMVHITLQVQNLLQQGIEPNRIAVIYKENKYGEELIKYFRLKKLPVFSKRSINILENAFAKKIIQILRYAAAEHEIPYAGDELLFEILHFDFYNIPPIEVAKLTVEVNQKKYSELFSLRRLLVERSNQAPSSLFDKGLDEQLKKVSAILEKLIADVSNLTLQGLFENVINEAGVLQYIMQSNDKIVLMQILTALFDFIKEETARAPLLSVHGLMEILDLMDKESIALPLVQISGSDNGVNLLTAHGAKGLEFEHVFFAGTNAHFWEKKKVNNKGFLFPDTMFSSLPVCNPEEELRRLFYVALTRAEQYLNISYFVYRADGKEVEPSMFIHEILQAHPIPIEKIVLPQEQVMEFEMLHFITQKPEIEKAEEDFIGRLLEKFSMNVSALNNYLNCPLEFYFKTLIRIPSGKSESLEFGSAMHFAVQRLFEKMQGNEKQEFNKADLVADFKWYMVRHRENFTKEGFERRLEYGEEILNNYYDQYANTWNKIIAVERSIQVVYNDIPIKGKIDKLEFNGKEVNVVDYKTGDSTSKWTKEKLWRPNDKQPNGGDYWRQAVFYKILVDRYENKQWKAVSTTFDFIEPDKDKKYHTQKIIIEPQDIETVTQQITEVWNKIQNRDFYTGCGKEDCRWCKFVKENKLAVSLHEMEEEV
ncbi:MAG TPA: ATP-dependent DNA helicase [Chitinophagaceae bacterium]|nr:ATP-dependent DNA helicase [Chitinophagaceae bacterium]